MRFNNARTTPGVAPRGGLIAAALLAALPSMAQTQTPPPAMTHVPDTPATRLLTALHQEILIHAPPARVYAALLSSAQFAAFTGLPATIDPPAGGAFSMFGGLVVGRNIELLPDRRIVQAWRLSEEWAPGTYSVVRFELIARDGGTLVILDHTGFPAGAYQHLFDGWYVRYWNQLDAFLR